LENERRAIVGSVWALRKSLLIALPASRPKFLWLGDSRGYLLKKNAVMRLFGKRLSVNRLEKVNRARFKKRYHGLMELYVGFKIYQWQLHNNISSIIIMLFCDGSHNWGRSIWSKLGAWRILLLCMSRLEVLKQLQ
jgi:hypothetical protein